RQHRLRVGGFEPGRPQRFQRQIEPSDAGVLVEVAQNIGELQGASQMMRELETVMGVHAEHAHRQPPDRAGDAVAIEIEPRQRRRADVLGRVHFHAVDDGEEIGLIERKPLDRTGKARQRGRGAAAIERIDGFAPLRQAGEPRRTRRVAVGDVVDLAAERIDLEHGLALLAAEDAHGEVERAAAGALGRAGTLAAFWHSERHGVWYRSAGALRNRRRNRPRATVPAPSAKLAGLLKCTGSLNGSRLCRIATRRSASLWMTATSSASRVSWMLSEKPRLCLSSPAVRATTSRRQYRKGGGARLSPSMSTPAPCVANRSSGI